jgi:hypothetical protein
VDLALGVTAFVVLGLQTVMNSYGLKGWLIPLIIPIFVRDFLVGTIENSLEKVAISN